MELGVFSTTSIVWFRQDLRIADNPALAHAAAAGAVVPVYILDESPPPQGRPICGASRWWLHHSLTQLSRALGGHALIRDAHRYVTHPSATPRELGRFRRPA